MDRPRFGIAVQMAFIALIALDIAIARALTTSDLIAFAPIGLALQFALVGFFRGRRRARPCWAGFLVGGTLAILSCLPPLSRPPDGYLKPTGPTSYLFVVEVEGSLPWRFWFAYTQLMFRHIGLTISQGSDSPVSLATIYFLPQLLAALIAGLLMHGAARTWWAARRRFKPSSEACRPGDAARGRWDENGSLAQSRPAKSPLAATRPCSVVKGGS